MHTLAPSSSALHIVAMEQNKNIDACYAIKLKDLRSWHMLTAKCDVCSHTAHLRLWQVTAGQLGNRLLMDIEKKLRCTRCGHRGENVVLVTLMAR